MKRTITLAALFAAGCAAALSLGVTRASAWSPTDLPPGWTASHEVSNAQTCPEAWRIHTVGNADFSNPFCTDSPTYQQDFDAWIDARYSPPPPPSTTTAPTTQPGVTTTVVVTNTTPAPTTTGAPADTTTPAPSPAPAAPVTTVITVTTVATPLEQSLQAQIDALAAKIAALTDRVSRLERAGDAAWLAFQQAVANGADVAAAADIARGTYLNAVYGLGSFA